MQGHYLAATNSFSGEEIFTQTQKKLISIGLAGKQRIPSGPVKEFDFSF
jgi:hypothetical protein